MTGTAPGAPAADDRHDLARGAAANALVLLAANFRGIFTFLIARLLGEAALGRFGLVFAATELLSKAGMLGLDAAIAPFVATRAANRDVAGGIRLFRRAVLYAVAASALLAAAAAPLAAWLATEQRGVAFSGGAWLMLLALPGIALARISTGAARGVLEMRNEFYSRGLTETWVTTGVFVAAVALGIRDAAPALAVVAGTTAAGLVAFALASRTLAARAAADAGSGRPGAGPDRLVSFAVPIAGSSLLNVLVTRLDILLLGAFVGRAPGLTVASFGVYCAAAEIAGGLRKVRQIFDPVFAPVVAARAAAGDRARLRETVGGPGRWVLAAQLPLVGALVLSGGAILSIYGPAFRDGALWLALLALAHGTSSFAGLVETLIMIRRPGINLVNAGVTVTVQLLAGLLFVPAWGATGGALAMCAGFAVQGVLRFVEVRRVFAWSWPWSSLRRPALAFACAFAPALALRAFGGPTAEVTSGLLFLALYLGAWRRLGAEPEDVEVWRRLRAAARRAPVEPVG